jgi:nickel transport system permease protein
MIRRPLIYLPVCCRRTQHWLGTDHLGRDIFSRLLAATRVSLGAVMACLLLVLALGLLVGGCAGLMGGRVDQLAMRVAECL